VELYQSIHHHQRTNIQQPAGIKFTRIVIMFSISMQSLGEIELRAPAVGAKNWCFFYVKLGLPARGGHSSNKYCVTVYGSILMQFQHFFRIDCSVVTLHSSHFVAR